LALLYLQNSVCACDVQRLCRSEDGTMMPCGFTELSDAGADDIALWLPSDSDSHAFGADVATYLVKHVTDVFCNMVHKERQAVSWIKPDSEKFSS